MKSSRHTSKTRPNVTFHCIPFISFILGSHDKSVHIYSKTENWVIPIIFSSRSFSLIWTKTPAKIPICFSKLHTLLMIVNNQRGCKSFLMIDFRDFVMPRCRFPAIHKILFNVCDGEMNLGSRPSPFTCRY